MQINIAAKILFLYQQTISNILKILIKRKTDDIILPSLHAFLLSFRYASIIELTLIYNTPNAFLHRKIDYFYIDFKLFTSYF